MARCAASLAQADFARQPIGAIIAIIHHIIPLPDCQRIADGVALIGEGTHLRGTRASDLLDSCATV
jgi:hypothetical protein